MISIILILLCIFVSLLWVGLYTRCRITLNMAIAIVAAQVISLMVAMLAMHSMLTMFVDRVTIALLLLFELLLCFALVFFRARRQSEALRQFAAGEGWQRWKKRLSFYTCLRLLIILLAFFTMWMFAKKWSLWSDDLATIYFVAENVPLSTNIARTLSEAMCNPPLFYVLAYFWLRIAPYGTAYLKLLSILFCCAGIWFCGTAAKQIAGDRTALIATVFSATSYFLISHAAYTFRSYGLVFLLCSLLIISYHKRLTEPEKICHYISYGLIHALMLYTHFVCGLITAILGLYDLWLFATKKIKLSFLWSYIGAGLAFLPLVFYVPPAITEQNASFWPSVPGLGKLMNTISLIFSNHVFLLSLFVLAVVFICSADLCEAATQKAKASSTEQGILIALVLWPLFVIGFIYVFSRYLFPDFSIFVNRYFIPVLAPIFIDIAIAMDRVLTALSEERGRVSSGILICSAILICYVCLEYDCLVSLRAKPGSVFEPYEQAVEWICAQEDAYQERCLIMFSGYQDGLYYYVTQGGKRPNLNFGTLDDQNWVYYDVVYVSPQHSSISSASQALLDTYYEEVERRDNLKVIKYCKN